MAIEKLNAAGIKCTALTKGFLPPELSAFSKENEYGITFVSLNESYRERMESGAAPYANRLQALRDLHDAGFKTWVSIEPYPTPNLVEQNLMEILDAVSFTDRIIFGRTNYSKEITAYNQHRTFYNQEAQKVIDFCGVHGIAYHIKAGTITKAEEKK